jgi:galactokinase
MREMRTFEANGCTTGALTRGLGHGRLSDGWSELRPVCNRQAEVKGEAMIEGERVQKLRQAFANVFGGAPDLVARAPGRVNLIGEHTDYSDGFVMPMAIDRDVLVAVRRRADSQIRLHSVDFGGVSQLHLGAPVARDGTRPWSNYPRGVVHILLDIGLHLGGFDLAFTGNVPSGAGLSSSAAVEVATLQALDALFGLKLPTFEKAKLGQRAEREFVGVACGIMDQAISAAGVAGHALMLDCRSLETTLVPMGAGIAVVVTDTSVVRGLVDSKYNDRRAECEAATAHFARTRSDVIALRDVTADEVHDAAEALGPVVARRARHVVTENARVLSAVAAFRAEDLVEVGRLMVASHASLRDDFEVTVPELDLLVELACAQPGVLGARMTGAGFGGCTVAIMPTDAVAGYVDSVVPAYEARTGLTPRVFTCEASDGASVVG